MLLDAQMPENEGCATIELIRAERRFDGMPIVAMADTSDETAANRCLAIGAAELLDRPIDPRRLKEVLEKHLKDDQRGGNSPSDP